MNYFYRDEFCVAWDAMTIRYSPLAYRQGFSTQTYDELAEPHLVEWIGRIDYSVSNVWTDLSPEGILRFRFGDVYRKEVCQDDCLGSYQTQSFSIDSKGVVTSVNDHYETAGFGSGGLYPLSVGFDIQAYYPDPTEAVLSFFHETGLSY